MAAVVTGAMAAVSGEICSEGPGSGAVWRIPGSSGGVRVDKLWETHAQDGEAL